MADDASTVAVELTSAGRQDDLLVRRFAQGDASAFDEIVTRHRPRITRLAFRLLAWSDDVEDVVQEVFLSAFRSLPQFHGRSSLGTWLAAITINKSRTYRRRRRLRLSMVPSVPPAIPLATSADRETMQAETFERVRRAVQVLPSRYREVVVLRYLEEMPTAEIAEVLGLSRDAVAVRLHRARARLKDDLGALIEEQS